MDSNEGGEEKKVDQTNIIEVSNPTVPNENKEQETDKACPEYKSEENDKNTDVSSICAKVNEHEDEVLPEPLEIADSVKINTDIEVVQAKKVTDNEKLNSSGYSDKDSDCSDMDVLELKSVSPGTPKDEENVKDFDYSVRDENVESTKNDVNVDIAPENKLDIDTQSLQSKSVEEISKDQSDNADVTDIKDTEIKESIESIEKIKDEKISTNQDEEGLKDVKEVVDSKDKIDIKETIDTNLDCTIELMDTEDKKEVKDTLDESMDVKEIKENTDPVKTKKFKKIVTDTESEKDTKTEIVMEMKDVKKKEENSNEKEVEEIPKPLQSKKMIVVRNNKILKDMKSEKETKDLKSDKNIKDSDDINMSFNTREGKRKRRSTMPSSMCTSPTIEEQQQQNGSASKRKRTTVVEAEAAAAAAAAKVAALIAGKSKKPATESSTAKVPCKNDKYCWRCHKELAEMPCSLCPRSWHRRCMGGAPPLDVTDWQCAECSGVQQAENPENRSLTAAQLTPEQLSVMLRHVVQRMRDQTGSEPFLKAVDVEDVPSYLDYVINPMDLSLLESNVRAKKYASTEAFMADARWIQHNCTVFNTLSSKLTNTAKQMLKVARQETSEIEACPDCFAHGRNLPRALPSWFIEPCRRPHPIVWAKLKGFPFWPAKAMPRLNAQGLVDVRFFGEHDRAWVSPKDIYLYSKEPPAGTPRKKKIEMDQCIKEVQDHIKKLERVFGEFKYCTQKIQYDPHNLQQIQIMLTNYDPIENKIIKKENPKPEVQTPPANNNNNNNNKVPTPKAERKSLNPKNAVTPNANGVTLETRPPSERRTMLRKKRLLSPQSQESSSVQNKTKKINLDIETVVVMPLKKGKSKSPPTNTPNATTDTLTVNNVNDNKSSNDNKGSNKDVDKNIDKDVNKDSNKDIKKDINKDVNKDINKDIDKDIEDIKKDIEDINKSTSYTSSTPNTTAKLDTSNSKINIPKPTLVPVKKVRQKVLKKIKLTKQVSKTDDTMKKPMVVVKTLKPATIIHAMPPMNNFSDNLETAPVKILGSTKKLVSILPKKNQNISRKIMNSKTIQVIQQDGKIINRMIKTINVPMAKEVSKFPTVTIQQPKNKRDSSPGTGNKSLPTIQLSARKDQKATLSEISSGLSETVKHLNSGEKEIKLNSAVSIIKQEPKEDASSPASLQPKLTILRKPSKARKSFMNKPPQFPQQQSLLKSNQNISSDSVVYIAKQNSSASSTPLTLSASATICPTSSSSATYELAPPEAGPLTAQIHRHSRELVNRMAQLIADSVKDAADNNGVGAGNSSVNHHEATIHLLKLKMERLKWEHDQELNNLRHNHELRLREMKASLEAEHHRALESARREAEIDKRRTVEETKRKQWCVVCGREAMFFCCWNTAYCDYPCQQKHWATHVTSCAQKNTPTAQASASPVTLQSQRHSGNNAARHQIMPKLVNTKPQQQQQQQQQSMPVMRKASS